MQKIWANLKFYVWALVLVWPLTSQAENYALLVGVSDYQSPDVPDLDGPKYDVSALQKLLVKSYRFKQKNIVTLVDDAAKKQNILKSLDDLAKKGKKGDVLFVYFSGHGTSAGDKSLNIPLGHTTGAFLPWDTQFDKKCVAKKDKRCIDNLMSSLLVGSNDVKPRLAKLEKKFEVTYINDSCYSANASRSLPMAQFTKRNLNLDFLDVSDKGQSSCGYDCGTVEKATYPYSNVISISSAGARQPAVDINWKSLKSFPTLDNKPHGAFTDALLRVMSGQLRADFNTDGRISNHEVFKAVNGFISTRGYGHNPVLLPALSDKGTQNYDLNFLGMQTVPTCLGCMTDLNAKPIRVEVSQLNSGQLSNLKKSLETSSVQFIKGKTSSYDLKLVMNSHGNSYFDLVDQAGRQVAIQLPNRQLAQAINAQAVAQSWRTQFVENSGKVHAYPQLIGQSSISSTLTNKDKLYFLAKANKAKHFLMFDIMNDGTIAILQPVSRNHVGQIDANQLTALPFTQTMSGDKADFEQQILDSELYIEITEPYGKENVFLFALDHWPKVLNNLIINQEQQAFSINSDAAKTLYKVLSENKTKVQTAYFDLFVEPVD